MKKYKLLDLFCGAGGLSLGFEKEDFETVLAIDSFKSAIDTYNYNRNEKVGIVRDITMLDQSFFNGIGNIDGIIGGPPCQGFSTAGKRGIDDKRNELYRDYFKIIDWVRPKFFLMENVTGILNFGGGNVKEDIIERARKLNYSMFYKVLNVVEYGVPQNRKRAIFVGIKNDLVYEEYKFPAGNGKIVTIEDAISDLPSLDKGENNKIYNMEPKTEYQKYIRNNCTALENHEQTAHTEETKRLISLVPEGGDVRDIPEELLDKKRKYNNLLRKMNRSKPSHTIDTGHRAYFHYEEKRIPSVREAARLQSFTDDYFFMGSKQDQYKQVGNAVPPLFSQVIAKSIKEYLDNALDNVPSEKRDGDAGIHIQLDIFDNKIDLLK